MDLGQCFHHEASVEMINKISYSIHGIKPRTVGVLILQNEIQISFCSPPVFFVAKNLGRTGEQEGAISCSVNYPACVKRRVGRTAGLFGCPEILDVSGRMSCNRPEDLLVLIKQI